MMLCKTCWRGMLYVGEVYEDFIPSPYPVWWCAECGALRQHDQERRPRQREEWEEAQRQKAALDGKV
jgi:hypothetical protein